MQTKGTPVYVLPSEAQIEMAFNAFDSDKGGYISAKELQQILSRCGVVAEIEHCDALVGIYGKKTGTDGELDMVGFGNMIKELFDLVSTSESLKRSQTVSK